MILTGGAEGESDQRREHKQSNEKMKEYTKKGKELDKIMTKLRKGWIAETRNANLKDIQKGGRQMRRKKQEKK